MDELQFSYVISREITPNEHAYKFIINHDFAGDIMWECDSVESASESELALSIWDLGMIARVFFHSNMVVVHKEKEAKWDELLDKICLTIDIYFRELRPLFHAQESTTDTKKDDRLDLLRQIIVDYIQPGLMSHGGFVRLIGLENDTLLLSMHGACNGCSSADETLELGIKRLINFYHPEIEVKLVG